MVRQLHAGLAFSLTLLVGCAGLPESRVDQPAWAVHRSQLDSMTHWTASGKIALRTADQAESASLLWQQAGEATHLRLSGPMGLSATTVDSNGQQLEIRQGEDHSRWDVSDSGELTDNPGWDLPLKALHH
jgi:outer membrane lipoprotein LolB